MAATELVTIKALAKKLARARRIKHVRALDITAQELGQPHWDALTSAFKIGWRPSSSQVDALRQLVETVNPLKAEEPNVAGWEAFSRVPGITLKAHELHEEIAGDPFPPGLIAGELDGHQFHLMVDFDEVVMEGRGWRVIVLAAPSARPNIYVTDRRIKANPILEKGFRERVLEVTHIRAEQMRARIASDWPRRSTIPDPDGKAQHPLFGAIADNWCCIHCDGEFSEKDMAENLWYCPACSATPIDIVVASEYRRRNRA